MRREILLRRHFLKAWPGSASLIEPAIGSTPGFPDAHLSYRQVTGLAEFKAIGRDCNFELEPSQRLWLLDNIEHNKRIAIVCLNEEGAFINPASLYTHKGMPLLNNGCKGRFLSWKLPELGAELFRAIAEAWVT